MTASQQAPSGRIAHINLAAGLRGGERQTLTLIEELAERGWQQCLIARPGAAIARALPPALRTAVPVRSAGHLLAAARHCRSAALVHAHDGRAVYAAALAGLTGARPYVITRRVMNPIRQRWSSRLAYRRAAAVVAISSAVATELTRFDDRLSPHVIASAYSPRPEPSGADRQLRARWGSRFIVGNVAALETDSKGQLTLVRLAREVADAHVVLVGSGRDEAMLRREAQGLANIEFAGQVDDVDAYLRAFDLFAFPSLREGFGSVLLDAMRAKLPVVVKSSGGIVDIVRNNENGVMVPADDDEGFIAAVRELMSDAGRRQALAEAGAKDVEAFAPAIMSSSYDALYRRLLSDPSSAETETA